MKIEKNNIIFITCFLILLIGGSASSYLNFENNENNISGNKNRIYEYYQVDKTPVFQGNNTFIDSVLYTNLKWIDGESFVHGTVIISCVITNEGKMKKVRVEKKLCTQCDENAIETFNNLTNWQPGIKQGMAVNTKMYIPISFVLQK